MIRKDRERVLVGLSECVMVTSGQQMIKDNNKNYLYLWYVFVCLLGKKWRDDKDEDDKDNNKINSTIEYRNQQIGKGKQTTYKTKHSQKQQIEHEKQQK